MNEMILHGLLYTECLVYLDDIIIYGKDFQSTLTNLTHVLERFAAVGATFKVSKCKFFLKELTYLGGIVTSEGVKCAGSAQAAVLEYTRPANISQLRRFLGLINCYSRFIRGASQLIAPLTVLTKSRQGKKISKRQRAINLTVSGPTMAGWTDECEQNFETLKSRLVDPELLRHPDYTKPFILTTDASDIAAAAILSQLDDDGFEHPVGYYGHVFDETERNYSATKREAFAIKWACQKLRHFLHGRLFTIITDHQALRHLETCKDKTLQRWALELQDLHYVIVHRPGKDIPHVDALSRSFPEPDLLLNSLVTATEDLAIAVDPPSPFVPPSLVAALIDTNCEISVPDFSGPCALDPSSTLFEISSYLILSLVTFLSFWKPAFPLSQRRRPVHCCHTMDATLLTLLTDWFILSVNLDLARDYPRGAFSLFPCLYDRNSCTGITLTSSLGIWQLTRLTSACLNAIGGPVCTRMCSSIFKPVRFVANPAAPLTRLMALFNLLSLPDPLT